MTTFYVSGHRLQTAPDIIRELTGDHQDMTGVVRALLGDRAIDEMALMFHDYQTLFAFVNNALPQPGVTLFNYAKDVVRTEPIESEYTVEYWFLTLPLPGVRLEALVQNGGSPLHTSVQLRNPHSGTGSVVKMHASFKCASEEEYGDACTALRRSGWELAQRCDSTYGKFSYWQSTCDPADRPQWFLKPRLNLRDGASA